MAGRTQLPEVEHEQPTAEDRRAGDVFLCPYCDRDWLKRDRHPHMGACINCGRRLRRERAARARIPEKAPEPPAVVRVGDIEVAIDDVAFEKVPQPVMREVDRVIEQTVSGLGAQSRRRGRPAVIDVTPQLSSGEKKKRHR